MKKDFETKFVGWSFIIGMLFLLFGYELLPHKLDEYFVASDFAEVGKDVWFWIWMYRVHIFGWVILGGAMMGLMAISYGKPQRSLIVPGAGIVVVGTFTMALAVAFYYTFGAYGVGQTEGKSPEEMQTWMDSFLIFNHYATCMIRFGRIFSSLGLIVLGVGLYKFKLMPAWHALYTALIGLVGMCLILFIHENYHVFMPVYYAYLLWMLLTGVWLLRNGINVKED